jgi:hypothetical protein
LTERQSEGETPNEFGIDAVYQSLDQSDVLDNAGTQLLRQFIREQVEKAQANPDLATQCAYELAGLMSARSVWKLPSDSPFMKVLEIAGELELPPAHWSTNVSWELMAELVSKL